MARNWNFTKPTWCLHIFFRTVFDIIWYIFSTKKIKTKAKDLQSPWTTNGIKKSSRRNQRLHNKLLKNRNEDNETEYKNYKKLFEAIKKRSKKKDISKLILTFKNNIKKTWEIIKDSIGKGKCNNQNFPKKVIVDNIAIRDETQIAENFNKFFTEIGPKLAKEIQTSTIKFDDYVEQCNTILPDNPVYKWTKRRLFFPSDK